MNTLFYIAIALYAVGAIVIFNRISSRCSMVTLIVVMVMWPLLLLYDTIMSIHED